MAETTESKTERAMRVARAAKDRASAAAPPSPIRFTKGDGVDAIPAAQAEAPGEEQRKPDGHSPKSKASRGVDPSMKTSWVDANFSPAEHERMLKVARHRGKKLSDLLAELIAEQLGKMREEFDADVAAFDSAQAENPTTAEAKLQAKFDKMSPAELEAYAAAELAKYDAMMAEIARRKA